MKMNPVVHFEMPAENMNCELSGIVISVPLAPLMLTSEILTLDSNSAFTLKGVKIEENRIAEKKALARPSRNDDKIYAFYNNIQRGLSILVYTRSGMGSIGTTALRSKLNPEYLKPRSDTSHLNNINEYGTAFMALALTCSQFSPLPLLSKPRVMELCTSHLLAQFCSSTSH